MIETVIASSVLIAALIALRYFFGGKIDPRLQYAIWLLVAIRLLVSFPVPGSPVSVLNVLGPTHPISLQDPTAEGPAPTGGQGNVIPPVSGTDTDDPAGAHGVDSPPQGQAVSPAITPDPAADRSASSETPKDLLHTVWLLGAAGVGLWFALQNALFYLNLRKTRERIEVPGYSKLPVYQSRSVKSPCLFGLKPVIYVHPSSLSDSEALRYILAHEETHYRHFDHLWAYLRCLCLALHWFNPLVWFAAALSRRDCEMACDHSTLNGLGDEHRKTYGHTLIDMIGPRPKPSDLLLGATTMTSGKSGIKERISAIAKKPKMLLSTLLIMFLSLVLIVGCTFTGANKNGPKNAVVFPSRSKDWQWAWTFSGFTSDKEGWFVGSSGVALGHSENFVYLTEDGGKNWVETGNVNAEWARVLTAASFADQNTGYLCFRYDIENIGRIYRTTDGGKTWALFDIPELESITDGVGEVRSLRFDDDGTGHIMFYYRTQAEQTGASEGNLHALVSDDGGLTWKTDGNSLAVIRQADLDWDGSHETICLDKSSMGDGFVTLSVVDEDGRTLWSSELSTSHAGWNQVFLAELEGKQYLLEYNPAMFQGRCNYAYSLYTLQEGRQQVSKAGNVEFDLNAGEPLAVDELVDFAGAVNDLLKSSVLLASSHGGEYHFGPSPADAFFERYFWLDELVPETLPGNDLTSRLHRFNDLITGGGISEPSAAERFSVSTGNIHDYMPRLLRGEAVTDYELLPCFENFTRATWLELERTYKGDPQSPGTGMWLSLLPAVQKASVSGDQADYQDQLLRDYYVGKAYLTSDGAYSEGLAHVVFEQWSINSTYYSDCLNGSFSAAESDALRKSIMYSLMYWEDFGPFGLHSPEIGGDIWLGVYPLDFPFGFELRENSRETHRAESFGQVTTVETDGFQVTYLNPYDGVFTVITLRANEEHWAAGDVAIGETEEFLQAHRPGPLRRIDRISYDDEAWFGTNYDHAYAFTPEESTKSVVYLIKDGSVVGIEAVNGLDGPMYPAR